MPVDGFYDIGIRVDIGGRLGVIEERPRPYWYGVRMEDNQTLEEHPEGSIKPIATRSPVTPPQPPAPRAAPGRRRRP